MTREELEQYMDLSNKFEDKCLEIIKILNKYPLYNCQKIYYADEFYMNGDNEVSWKGSDTFWGETEYYSGSFPAEFITLSGRDLERRVEEENKIYLEELEREKISRMEQKDKLEYEKYLELKKKYEKNS